jgi:hypothetical protein
VSFILILRELWQRRRLVALVTFVAFAVAVVAVYQASFFPPSLSKRDHSEAKGSIEILVDSNRSPIADVAGKIEPLTIRAGVFARYIAGGHVIGQIATRTGIPFEQIEVAGPAPLPGEAIGVTAPPEHLKPYGIAIVQRDELPIVNVETRAPSLDEARALAAATPGAIRAIVTRIQAEQQIPAAKQVTFRVLGPAQANLATTALGAKVALGIFVLLEALGLLLILGIPRLIEAWSSTGAVAAEPPKLEAIPRVPPRSEAEPTALPDVDEDEVEDDEEVAEPAKLGTSHGGDG